MSRNAQQVADFLACYKPQPPSENGLRVALLLEQWLGLHHIRDDTLRKTAWDNPRFVEMKLPGEQATYDFNELTRLVFLAHDHGIRVAITPSGPQFLRLLFHPRAREGGLTERHPTLEQALAAWREKHPHAVDSPSLVTNPKET